MKSILERKSRNRPGKKFGSGRRLDNARARPGHARSNHAFDFYFVLHRAQKKP